MNREKLMKNLRMWEEDIKNLIKLDDLIVETFKCGDVLEEIFILSDNYTDVLEKRLGIKEGILSWYAWENDFGSQGRHGIYTIDNLVDYILKGD